MKLTDEALRLAARQVCRAMAEALPAPEDCDHQFSPAFRRKMRPLLRRRRQHPILRRIAAAVLAAFVGFGAWLLVDSDARASLLRWVKEVYDTHIVYRFFGAPNPAADPAAWAPTWLPQGYEEVERRTWEGELFVIYENEENQQILFGCSTMHDRTANSIFLENGAEDLTEVCGLPAAFHQAEKGDSNLLIWVDETQGLYFDLAGYCDKSVMLHMAESVSCTPAAADPATDSAAWAPAWLPQGYEEAERHTLQGESLTLSVYERPDGSIISFTCGIMQQGTAGMVIPENAVEEEVAVSDLPGFFYADPTGSNENLLIWTDEIHCLNFSLQSYEDQSVMLHIAESVKLAK